MNRGDLGRTIRRLREAAGMTQEELGIAANIHQSYISQIEAGKRKAPGMGVIAALAKALHVEVGDLYQMAGLIPPSGEERDPDLEILFHEFQQLDQAEQEDVRVFIQFLISKRQQRRQAEQS